MSDPVVQSAAGSSGLTQWQRVTNTFTAPSTTLKTSSAGNKSWWLRLSSCHSWLHPVCGRLFKIGMQNVVDNQIRLDPKASDRMAQATPEQREMGSKISLYITEGVFIANPALVLAGVALLSLGYGPPSTSSSAAKPPTAAFFTVWIFATLPTIVKTLLGFSHFRGSRA